LARYSAVSGARADGILRVGIKDPSQRRFFLLNPIPYDRLHDKKSHKVTLGKNPGDCEEV
jgi:hypothetical protein